MKRLEDLAMDICSNLHHGECLYDEKMFNKLMLDIQNLANQCKAEFENNQKEE